MFIQGCAGMDLFSNSDERACIVHNSFVTWGLLVCLGLVLGLLLVTSHVLRIRKILLGGSLLHLDLLLVLHGSKHSERILIIACFAKLSRRSDLLLDLLRALQDVNGEHTLSLDGLTIRAILGLIDDNLSLLDLLDHGLLHGLHDAAGLLNVGGHVHGWHTTRVALTVNEHLLLLGLIILTLASVRVIVSLVTAIAINNGRLSKHVRVAHLARHANLLDHAAIHR